jgi:hypothetical protein
MSYSHHAGAIRQEGVRQTMMDRSISTVLRRIAPEMMVGAIVFFLIVTVSVADAGLMLSPEGRQALAATSWNGIGQFGTVLLLAGVLSALIAFDVAVLRHVYRVYAEPRSRRRQRDIRTHFSERC